LMVVSRMLRPLYIAYIAAVLSNQIKRLML